ncbi:MAG: hypothetical protein R3C51_05895 [Parvularculaceae bacterium]
MKTVFWAFALSAVAVGFIAVYFGASVYFCAGVGEGRMLSCAELIGAEMSASPTTKLLVLICALCLAVSLFYIPRRVR